MSIQLLQSTDVRLRALEPEDLDLLYTWENNTAWWQLGSTIQPFSRFDLKEYLSHADKSIYALRQLRLMVVEKESGAAVGTVDLYEFDPHHKRAGVGILIDEHYQQLGYASQVLQLLKEYAFDFLHLHSLFAHIGCKNSVSVKLFDNAGFHQTGLLKDWLRHSESFEDVLVFQLISNKQ